MQTQFWIPTLWKYFKLHKPCTYIRYHFVAVASGSPVSKFKTNFQRPEWNGLAASQQWHEWASRRAGEHAWSPGIRRSCPHNYPRPSSKHNRGKGTQSREVSQAQCWRAHPWNFESTTKCVCSGALLVKTHVYINTHAHTHKHTHTHTHTHTYTHTHT